MVYDRLTWLLSLDQRVWCKGRGVMLPGNPYTSTQHRQHYALYNVSVTMGGDSLRKTKLSAAATDIGRIVTSRVTSHSASLFLHLSMSLQKSSCWMLVLFNVMRQEQDTCMHIYIVIPICEHTMYSFGLNVFYSGINYWDKVWVRPKVQHHPLHYVCKHWV